MTATASGWRGSRGAKVLAERPAVSGTAPLALDVAGDRVDRAEVLLGDLDVLRPRSRSGTAPPRPARRSRASRRSPRFSRSSPSPSSTSGLQVEEVVLDEGPHLRADLRCIACAVAHETPLVALRERAVDPYPRLGRLGRIAATSQPMNASCQSWVVEDADERPSPRAPPSPARSRQRRTSPSTRSASQIPASRERLGRERLVDPAGGAGPEERGHLGRPVGLLAALGDLRRQHLGGELAAGRPCRSSPSSFSLGRQARPRARRRGGRGTGSGPRPRAPSRRDRPGRRAGRARAGSSPPATRRARGRPSPRSPSGSRGAQPLERAPRPSALARPRRRRTPCTARSPRRGSGGSASGSSPAPVSSRNRRPAGPAARGRRRGSG